MYLAPAFIKSNLPTCIRGIIYIIYILYIKGLWEHCLSDVIKVMTSVSACLMHQCIIALAQYQKPEINKVFHGTVWLKELYKTFRGKHRAKQERKALRGAVQKKDCLCILLTDFRKALIFQPLPFV